ncbi:helix-turn-helix transcriptional regulator [Plantactinospora sp. B5E13]|uniref:helix-turn-helix domain-containing protein n=1 Tax=Plantactinospora sp. B5E13 TaxID=3153758 RepID=UPI00325ED09A
MGISPLEFLLREIRRRRLAAGLTQAALGQRIHFSDTQISGVETGTKPVNEGMLKALDRALETGGLFIRLWEDLVRDGTPPLWFLRWLEIEREATALRWFESMYVPGPFQTEAYARATLAGESHTPDEVDQLIAARLSRWNILTRERPPLLAVVIDEAVVRRGAPEARDMMSAQLAQLLSYGELPHVRLQVVPTRIGMYPGYGGPFVLADAEDGRRYAHVDGQLAARIRAEPADIATLASRWERIKAVALPVDQSKKLLEEVAASWS